MARHRRWKFGGFPAVRKRASNNTIEPYASANFANAVLKNGNFEFSSCQCKAAIYGYHEDLLRCDSVLIFNGSPKILQLCINNLGFSFAQIKTKLTQNIWIIKYIIYIKIMTILFDLRQLSQTTDFSLASKNSYISSMAIFFKLIC